MTVRKAVEVSGIVQGVGFRPYVFRLAMEGGLVGSIANTESGVAIEIQGCNEAVEDFLVRLPVEAPPLAQITGTSVHDVPPNGDTAFRILTSRAAGESRTLISPDVAICDDCLRELFDPADRRYLYPFINCTNCGPRFTIVRDIPYDRVRTSMAVFPMCEDCRREYEDPANRRFHAEPNACWECGPSIELWDSGGGLIETSDPLGEAAARLRAGQVVAVKGLGGFHLAADATNRAAVERLRNGKQRVEKPFAVMVADLEAAERLAVVDGPARSLLIRPERPIVVVPKREPSPILDAVAPFNRTVGVFLPYTPLHSVLFAKGGFEALVMTSGNRSEEPIAIDNREAVQRLSGLADCFVVHNREILLRADDSVTRVAGGRARSWRRSRGYVPVPIFLDRDVPPILATGGELKNTICLTKGRHAFLSQHIGDLENLEGFRFFEEAVEYLKRILEIEPRIVACDLHPGYFSTGWAHSQTGVRLMGVQHHHAHIASCMAENHLDGRVIGIALDGTGYGTDGHIWGGEVLLAGYDEFDRAAHLDYVPMPGGVKAIEEPWRMALGYLAHHFERGFLDWKIPFLKRRDRRQVEVLLRMIERGVNTPLTSSCGRLFDAVAALAGIRDRVNYEGQAAIELEMAMADPSASAGDQPYPISVREASGCPRLDTRPLFEELIRDLEHGAPTGRISLRFHLGLVDVFAKVASILRDRTGLNRVCLSGGSFQNVYLLENLLTRLTESRFEVFSQAEVPPGDGGLSLGQALVAAHCASLPDVRRDPGESSPEHH